MVRILAMELAVPVATARIEAAARHEVIGRSVRVLAVRIAHVGRHAQLHLVLVVLVVPGLAEVVGIVVGRADAGRLMKGVPAVRRIPAAASTTSGRDLAPVANSSARIATAPTRIRAHVVVARLLVAISSAPFGIQPVEIES